MATIQKRVSADGKTVKYRAQVKVIHQGETHRESATFAKKADAKQYAIRREAEIRAKLEQAKIAGETPNITQVAKGVDRGVSVKRLIELYEEKAKPLNPWGRSKQQVLEKLKHEPLFQVPATSVDAALIIEYCNYRRTVHEVSGATVGCDLSFLRSVFGVAKHLLGVDVGVSPFQEAAPTLKKLGLVAKSGERDRRPMVEEITDIVSHMYKSRTNKRNRWRSDIIPHDKIVVFAMFSGRRREEISKLEWANLDRKKRQIYVENLKSPNRSKEGQYNATLTIPEEAFAVIESMPEEGRFIFPYQYKNFTSGFDRARRDVGLNHDNKDDNLKFHDLRHECLSWLAEKNGLPGEHWDLVRIKQVSGHKSFKQLERYINTIEQKPVDRWEDWEWKTKVLE